MEKTQTEEERQKRYYMGMRLKSCIMAGVDPQFALVEAEMGYCYQQGWIMYDRGQLEIREHFLEEFGVPIDSTVMEQKGMETLEHRLFAYEKNGIIWVL